MRRLPFPILGFLLAVAAAGCDDGGPTGPTGVSTMTFTEQTPSGSVITVTGTPPGAFIPRGSGRLSVGLQFSSVRDVPWAQLYVYLLTPDGYCAQNLPDAPTWGPFPAGQTTSHTVTGFQVYRLPCDVTGIRAILHTRNSGLLTPPTASEIIVQTFSGFTYQLRQ